MSLSTIPHSIRQFLLAIERRDGDGAGDILLDEATLAIRGDRISGRRGVSQRLTGDVLRDTRFTRAIDGSRRGAEIVVTVLSIEDNRDGYAEEIHRDWHFALNGDRIAAVRIENRKLPRLSPPVAGFFQATNCMEIERVVACFAEDALVNDRLRDYWGKREIADWATREIHDQRLALHAVKSIEHHGQFVVVAHVNGDFDRRGLPDPIVLNLYFSTIADRIVQLIILPAEIELTAG